VGFVEKIGEEAAGGTRWHRRSNRREPYSPADGVNSVHGPLPALREQTRLRHSDSCATPPHLSAIRPHLFVSGAPRSTRSARMCAGSGSPGQLIGNGIRWVRTKGQCSSWRRRHLARRQGLASVISAWNPAPIDRGGRTR